MRQLEKKRKKKKWALSFAPKIALSSFSYIILFFFFENESYHRNLITIDTPKSLSSRN